MNLPEYNKKLGNVIKNLENNYNGEIMVKVAIEAFTKIRGRVQETGVNAKGQKFKSPVPGSSTYSTKDTLVGCKTFLQKSVCQTLLGSKPKRKKLEWRTVNGHRLAILPGGYKKIRELEGRQTNHVDFSVTNDMWNDIMADKNPSEKDLLSSHSDHIRGVAIIGAKRDLEKKKLSGHTTRFGDILDLSQKEIDELKHSYGLRTLQVFRNNGL